MKRFAIWLAAIVATVIAVSPGPACAQDVSVTGVGEATFPNGTQFNGVTLEAFQFESGVVIPTSGAATGEFHGTLIGVGRSISLEGRATSGSAGSDGSVAFTGTGTLDQGNGQIDRDISFTVTTSAQGLFLTVGETMLPQATVISGSLRVSVQ